MPSLIELKFTSSDIFRGRVVQHRGRYTGWLDPVKESPIAWLALKRGAGSRETSMRPVLPMKSVDRLSCFQVHDFRIDVFRADAEADNAGGDPPESWKSRKQPGRNRRFEG
jgi:hypothetical protein